MKIKWCVLQGKTDQRQNNIMSLDLADGQSCIPPALFSCRAYSVTFCCIQLFKTNILHKKLSSSNYIQLTDYYIILLWITVHISSHWNKKEQTLKI